MFGSSSRYASQTVAVFVDAEGRSRAYVTLRELPPARVVRPEDPIHIVTDSDRLDRLTWQHLGDPELFWRVCDANGALHPDEMTSVAGRRLVVPLDQRAGNG